MKRVTAFLGSARKKNTYSAARQFLDNLQSLGDIEGELVALSDYRLEVCRGCMVCFEKGEEFCPLKDDRDELFGKVMASDGVVLASPNYSFQVSGRMKIFLDRFGFAFHRPRFFGKTFTGIVTQGIYGGDRILQYLDLVGGGLGFNTVKGSCITAFSPMSAGEKKKMDAALSGQGRRFHDRLFAPGFPVPTLFKLWGFRYARTSMRLLLDGNSRDYCYYRDKGWFESDYFYPARLGVLKSAAGTLFDSISHKIARRRAC